MSSVSVGGVDTQLETGFFGVVVFSFVGFVVSSGFLDADYEVSEVSVGRHSGLY